MSDYVRKKVIRLPFPKSVLNACETEDYFECEDYLKNLLGEIFTSGITELKKIQIRDTNKDYYLDYVYYYTHGEESSDFGYVSLLSKEELKKMRPIFDKLGVFYNDSDLRKVDYCYYNCCEPNDYYSLDENDDSGLL